MSLILKLSALAFCALSVGTVSAQGVLPLSRALEVADRVIGGVTTEALSVRGSDGRTYIATLSGLYEGDRPKAYLLRSFGTSYAIVHISDTDSDANPACSEDRSITLADFGDDGIPDLLHQYECGGSRFATSYYDLYDPSSDRSYLSTLNYAHSGGQVGVDLAPGMPRTVRDRMEAIMSQHPSFPDADEERDNPSWHGWFERFGRFSDRAVSEITIDGTPRPLPESGCPNPSTCDWASRSYESGEWTYYAFFRGPVQAINEAEGVYIDIYVPKPLEDTIVGFEEIHGVIYLFTVDSYKPPIEYYPYSHTLRWHDR